MIQLLLLMFWRATAMPKCCLLWWVSCCCHGTNGNEMSQVMSIASGTDRTLTDDVMTWMVIRFTRNKSISRIIGDVTSEYTEFHRSIRLGSDWKRRNTKGPNGQKQKLYGYIFRKKVYWHPRPNSLDVVTTKTKRSFICWVEKIICEIQWIQKVVK